MNNNTNMNYPMTSIDPEAKIGKDVKIWPFVTIAKDVEIGEGTEIMSNVTILDGARIGKNCHIFPGAVISAIPQDLKFKGETTTVQIGDNTTIREFVTVNRGTASKGTTKIGDNCLIMAYNHIGHDCDLANHIIMSNACQIAGEVIIDDYATIGGGTLVHQFSHIGGHVMVQGGSKISKDIPPYIMAGREPTCFVGLNSVGLRRRNYSVEQVDRIQHIYRLIYQSGYNISQGIELVENELPDSEEKTYIINFIKSSQRGVIRGSIDM